MSQHAPVIAGKYRPRYYSLGDRLPKGLFSVVEVQLDGKEYISGRIDAVLPEETPEVLAPPTGGMGDIRAPSAPSKGLVVLDYVSSKHVIPSNRITHIKMPLHPSRGNAPTLDQFYHCR